MAYAGRVKGCGCLVAATVDMEGRQKEVARDVKEMIECGLEVTRVDLDGVRLTMQRCDHGEEQANLFAEAVPSSTYGPREES